VSNNIHEGRVWFGADQGMHLQEYCSVDDKPLQDDKKVRLAYMIVSLKETKELVGEDETDKEKILKQVKEHYSPYLKEAIEKESENLVLSNLKVLLEVPVKKKIVKLSKANLSGVKSYGTAVKGKNYTHAYNNELEKSFKTNDNAKSVCTLEFSRGFGDNILVQEQQEETPKSYIIISMPYVYNLKKDSRKEELEVTISEDKTTISYMPELIVEYGIFYDGTKNNMYNIDFYRNFSEFLKEPAEYIQENKNRRFEPLPLEKTTNIQDYILRTPDPKLSPEVIKKIISQIDERKDIRYFDEKSNLDEEDETAFKIVLESTKADHAKKVFEYLVDVKNGKAKVDEGTVGKFVQDKILPQDGDSSFTNGKTNIERLYHLYDGDDVKTNKDALPVTRFKLYESGSGTHNPYVDEDYEADNTLFGLGTGEDETGVIAHIIYSCEKIADQLREANISHVDELVLDVFGFSRGATSARHFVCSILKYAELVPKGNREYSVKMKDVKDIFEPFYGKDGHIVYGGRRFYNPLKTDVVNYRHGKVIRKNPFHTKAPITIDSLSFRFVGIYDTVTHYGFVQSNDYKDLNIDFFANDGDKKVGQIAHLMADDEYRYNFDAYSIFESGQVKHQKIVENKKEGIVQFEEITFPGAHADVGGGYNVESETVKIGMMYVRSNTISMKLKKKIENWNSKYHWMETTNVIQAKSLNEIKDAEVDGFYCIIIEAHRPYNNFVTYIPPVHTAFIYMHKKQVHNTYEHVSLKLMHNRAVYKNVYDSVEKGSEKDGIERVPFGSLTNYDFSNDTILSQAYKELESNTQLKEKNLALYKQLKHKYLHHSSNYADWLVNRPSSEDKEDGDFYGKRVIYTSTGTKYTRG
jgi:hypothetical protein